MAGVKGDQVEATLVEFLRARAEEFGRRPALLFRPGFRYQRWSYADLWEDAGRIATLLQQRGLSKGDRALIWGPNCPQWVLALSGCLRAGRGCRAAGRAQSARLRGADRHQG